MGKFKLEGETITLTYPNGVFQIFKINRNPVYGVGTIYLDFADDRYFLIS